MSETDFYTGKLTMVAHGSIDNLEEKAQEILASKGIATRDDFNDTWMEQLLDDCYDEYVMANNYLYRIDRQKKDAYDDIYEAVQNEDGTISFTVKYYNGGCSFSEAIGYALDNLEDNQ